MVRGAIKSRVFAVAAALAVAGCETKPTGNYFPESDFLGGGHPARPQVTCKYGRTVFYDKTNGHTVTVRVKDCAPSKSAVHAHM